MWAGSGARVSSEVIVPGRILLTELDLGTCQNDTEHMYIMHFNIHNHGLTARQITRTKNIIQHHIDIARRRPDRYYVVLAGDFNLAAEAP
eukprot:1808539-Pyramimonas_sp.AAC.1